MLRRLKYVYDLGFYELAMWFIKRGGISSVLFLKSTYHSIGAGRTGPMIHF